MDEREERLTDSQSKVVFQIGNKAYGSNHVKIFESRRDEEEKKMATSIWSSYDEYISSSK